MPLPGPALLALLAGAAGQARAEPPLPEGLRESNLLFPNSKGKALEKQVLHDALSRLSVRFEGPLRLTPGLIRRAFIQLKA